MKKILGLIVIAAILFLLSCKDEEEPLRFDVELSVTELRCYPNDSISMTFVLSSSGGYSPYTCHWMNPSAFTGNGPFTMNITRDTLLEAQVVDGNGTVVEFKYEILKDTIDSLKYDYRNDFLGYYNCWVHYRWIDSLWVCHDSYFQDTIKIVKHFDFRQITITNWQSPVYFNFKDSTFSGYHTDGRFCGDSVMFSYYLTPIGLESWEYKGVKMK